jgi:asparagine synthase (glutamine-hydrolysing)
MCGIAGILTSDGGRDLRPALNSMRAALRHRGPDDEGLLVLPLPSGGQLGLTHTRLAIQDLTPAGHQPMHDAAADAWLALNGEVYNHRELRAQLGKRPFCSSGDTETVLRAWVERGESALGLLRGMFAFAVYDARRQSLWLARDRLGVKPLYAARTEAGDWLFASEVRALLASGLLPRRLNHEALAGYLAFGSVAAPQTLVAGATSLMPGEIWRFDLRDGIPATPIRRRYWSPPFVGADEATVHRREAIDLLRPVLREAARLRMVSDVPVGVFLSGGIDSSSVVSLLAAEGFALQTFSVAFGEKNFDESAHAQRIAAAFGTQHTELLLEPRQVIEQFENAISAYDQPSLDGLNTYFLSRTVRQAGVRVALSGLGGDEIFAGYPSFRTSARLDRRLFRLSAWLAHQWLRLVRPQAPRTRKLRALLAAGGSRIAQYAVYREVVSDSRRHALLGRENGSSTSTIPNPVRTCVEEDARSLDAVNAHSLLELSFYLANTLLRDSDQMSMAHALELREPLLDHVLVETVARIPGRLKLASGNARGNKSLLLDSLPRPLPADVVRRRKMGFVFPWAAWLRRELRDRAAQTLLNRSASVACGMEPDAVEAFWNDFQADDAGIPATNMLCLIHLLHWVQRNRVAV